jgi:hypothetical protein
MAERANILVLAAPTGLGLGVEMSDETLEKYRVALTCAASLENAFSSRMLNGAVACAGKFVV